MEIGSKVQFQSGWYQWYGQLYGTKPIHIPRLDRVYTVQKMHIDTRGEERANVIDENGLTFWTPTRFLSIV